MINSFRKIEVALVLPVFSSHTSFLKEINRNCIELAIAMPDVNWTVIIINDGSIVIPSQNELSKQLFADISYYYYHYENNRGKGYAVRFGLNKAADMDLFIYTDYDFPFGTDAVISTVNILRQQKAEIVAADRGANYLSYLPIPRRVITKISRFINSKILKLNFTDTQAGLKGMTNRSLPVMLHTITNGFLFDAEFIRAAEQEHLQIQVLAVACAKDIELKNFSLSTIYTELKNLISVLFKTRRRNATQSSSCGNGEILHSTEVWTNTFQVKAGQTHFIKKDFPSAI